MIIGKEGKLCDALSTAIYVMGLERKKTEPFGVKVMVAEPGSFHAGNHGDRNNSLFS